jgi:hypothetical protein
VPVVISVVASEAKHLHEMTVRPEISSLAIARSERATTA